MNNLQGTPTKEQITASLRIMVAVTEAIREAGRIPSGVIYATLIGKVSHEGYQSLIRTLTNTGLVQELPTHELVWTGPELKGAN